MKTLKISQSHIKTWFAYQLGNECGIIAKERVLNGLLTESDDSMKLGIWFEYKLTGALPKSGEIPQPETLKSGKLAADYERMLTYEPLFAQMLNSITDKPKVEAIGQYYEHELKDGIIINGVCDLVISDSNGKKIIIDIKTSGKIDDKWNEFGWADDGLEYKHNHAIQALHYKILGYYEYGYIPDFYFFVFSTKPEQDAKNIKAKFSDDAIQRHLNTIKAVKEGIESEMQWRAIPEFKRCAKCVLHDSCKFKTNVPLIKDVYFNL